MNQAVRDAEAATSAEIVPVVARCSGRYDRPEDIVGLWFAALAMIIVWTVYPLPRAEAGSWDATAPVWQLVALLAGALVGDGLDVITEVINKLLLIAEKVIKFLGIVVGGRKVERLKSQSAAKMPTAIDWI